MKKYAMMLMNPRFVPEQHNAMFQTGSIENHILTVRTPQEAMEKIHQLMEQGFGVLEVCGAFEPELVQQMQQLSAGKLCIGHIVYPEDQLDALEHFWTARIWQSKESVQ